MNQTAMVYPIRDTATAPTREALNVLEAFAAGAQSEIEAGLARGVAFPTMLDGTVAWVHPDGTVRTARAAGSAILRR